MTRKIGPIEKAFAEWINVMFEGKKEESFRVALHQWRNDLARELTNETAKLTRKKQKFITHCFMDGLREGYLSCCGKELKTYRTRVKTGYPSCGECKRFMRSLRGRTY